MASNEQTYAELNYTIKQGDSFAPEHRFQNEDATAMNITGRTFSLVITQWATVITVAWTVSDPATGIVIFSVTKTQMATLSVGKATYEAKYTSGASTEQTYLVGTINIT